MGLFGFGGSKVDKHVKKLTNAWVQTVERKRAAELLADMGTDEALYGLLKRFTFRTEASIVDEDEKRLVFELVVGAGEAAIAPIERFVSEHDAVYWPLKALGELAGLEAAVALLLRALDKASSVDLRRNEQRAQLVANLRDFPHPDIQSRLATLCHDDDEQVRTMALDGIMTYGKDVALPLIMERVLHPDETAAVRAVLFEQLVDSGWDLKPWKAQVLEREVLPAFYRIGGKGVLERA